MLKQRAITAAVLAVLLLAALFGLPRIGWATVVLGMVLVGTAEWGRLSRLSKTASIAYGGLTFAAMAALAYVHLGGSNWPRLLDATVGGIAAVFWVIIVPAWLVAGWHVHNRFLLALIGWVVLIPTGLAMMGLRDYSPWLLLGVMGLVWVADIAAYFAGRRFGKRKLAPSISPGKTWEGVAGAVLGVTLYVVILYATQEMWSPGPEVRLPALPIVVVISWFWVALSILGDLFESAIKRQAGVKDSGALLPGHGGLLDRIDALTSTLPLAALALLAYTMT